MTFEVDPRFEDAFAWDVLEGPLQRDTAGVDLMAIVGMLGGLGSISKIVTGLDRVPAKMFPMVFGALSVRDERNWSTVVRHLDLASQIVVVHDVPEFWGGEPCDGASGIQIDAEGDVLVGECAEVFCGTLEVGEEKAESWCEDPAQVRADHSGSGKMLMVGLVALRSRKMGGGFSDLRAQPDRMNSGKARLLEGS
jgi:hypothetical protein